MNAIQDCSNIVVLWSKFGPRAVSVLILVTGDSCNKVYHINRISVYCINITREWEACLEGCNFVQLNNEPSFYSANLCCNQIQDEVHKICIWKLKKEGMFCLQCLWVCLLHYLFYVWLYSMEECGKDVRNCKVAHCSCVLH